ncbi:hypothetical protein PF010_g5563 [Phytophthora fragariae]|uniref:Uncharacterized protein n=1 Tax=Phytophthora fragariae TaxID=53985 RepID=A0A6G0LNK4_9STRA|nr:hypothetical protein PF010_g5563 [Phytophthora fragariae]KAE9351950.1 hypothetical protein PF008_g5691 [Phytophthora fragariae]
MEVERPSVVAVVGPSVVPVVLLSVEAGPQLVVDLLEDQEDSTVDGEEDPLVVPVDLGVLLRLDHLVVGGVEDPSVVLVDLGVECWLR